MLLDVSTCRNVTRVTVTKLPFSMTVVISTTLTVPLIVPVLIAPRTKNLLPHPHKETNKAKTSVSDRRRFTTPPPFTKKESDGDFTPNAPVIPTGGGAPAKAEGGICSSLAVVETGRVERTLLSVAFDFDLEFPLLYEGSGPNARATVEERRFSAA